MLSTTRLFSTASICLVLLVAWGTRARAQEGSSAQGGTGTKAVNGQSPSPGTGIYDTMPPPLPDAGESVLGTHGSPEIPFDPEVGPVRSFPGNPATSLGPEMPAAGKTQGAQAAGDFSTIRNTALDPQGASLTASQIDEPSMAVNGRVVFYTGNWFAAFSGDGGQNFQFVDPADNFPPDGTNDQPSNSGTFCCDQIVHYEETRGLMVWLLQYNSSGNNANQDSNVQRLAIANSQEDVLTNNWFWWDWSPADFGYNSTGFWFDYPDITYTDKYLYMTTNVFVLPIPAGQSGYDSSVLVRFPLDELADGGNVSYRYWTRSTGTLRPVQGANDHMYVGTHVDSNTLRVYHVADNSNSLQSEDIDHNGYNIRSSTQTFTDNFTAACSDGTDYANRGDSRVMAGWYSSASGEVGFMWNADESDGFGDVSTSFPFPYVRAMRIRVSNWSIQQQFSIWNSNHAWLYPSVNVNDRGHLGGTITAGCGNIWPRALAWINDDYSNPGFPSFGALENYAFAGSNDGPNNNSWGDYLTTRRIVPYSNTWGGTGFRLTGGGNRADVVPEFVWFGRERDMPPATNDIYVDLSNSSGHENGTQTWPFNTVDEGEWALQPLDRLYIQTGTYDENMLFNTEARVINQGGTVYITGPGSSALMRREPGDERPSLEQQQRPSAVERLRASEEEKEDG